MTAVEQLIHDMRNIDMSIFNDEHCKKYLEMEKQQIIDAHKDGAMFEMDADKIGNDYYNETYGSKGSDETNSGKPNVLSSQTEISDDEIFEGVIEYCKIPHDRILAEVNAMIEGAKWYRTKLKTKI